MDFSSSSLGSQASAQEFWASAALLVGFQHPSLLLPAKKVASPATRMHWCSVYCVGHIPCTHHCSAVMASLFPLPCFSRAQMPQWFGLLTNSTERNRIPSPCTAIPSKISPPPMAFLKHQKLDGCSILRLSPGSLCHLAVPSGYNSGGQNLTLGIMV